MQRCHFIAVFLEQVISTAEHDKSKYLGRNLNNDAAARNQNRSKLQYIGHTVQNKKLQLMNLAVHGKEEG